MVVAKVIRCLMVAVYIAALPVASLAEVLVYDGFASSAYTIADKGTGTLSSYPKVYNDTMIGFSEKLWQMSGSQPKVWGYGLNFPSSFAAAGIAAKGEWSIGPNGGGSNKANRDTSREFTSKLLNKTAGSLYFRVLMHLDKTAADMLPSTDDTLKEGSSVDVNYWGIGFSPQYGTDYAMLNTPNGAFGFFFRKNKSGAVSVIFRGKGADGTKLEHELCAVPAANTGLRDDNTYIAYARIDLNAGANGGEVIFAGAQNITAYSPDAAGEAFSRSIGELDLFNDTVYPKTLVFDGCYQTQGRVYFDEIGVATTAEELLEIEMPVPVDSADFEYSFEITLSDDMQAALGIGKEDDFPVLVRLSESGVSGFKYSDFSEADYSDLAFTDSQGDFLDYEVDTWDASGTSLVWVRVPSLSMSTKITCRYGGPKYKHRPENTWKKFAAVIHCGESIKDSSVNKLSVDAKATTATEAGVVGGGVVKAANNSIGLNLESPAGALTSSGKFSVMAWYKRDGNGGNNNGTHILSGARGAFGSGNGFLVLQEQGKFISVAAPNSHQWSSGAYKLDDKVWGHVAFTYEKGVKLISYFNGNKDQEKASPGALDATAAQSPNWTFGSYANTGTADSFKGEMDEIRVYDGIASAAWLAADYHQMMNAGALVCSTVVAPDPELPKLKDCEAVVNDAGNIVVSGKLLRHAAAVEVTLSAEGRTPIVVSLGDIEDGGTFERELGEDDGLLRFVDYTVTITAKNGEKVSEKGFADPVKYGKVGPGDYVSKFTATLSDAVRELLGSDTYADFPVLVRIPAEASAALDTGREIMVRDETEAELSWELETLNPKGQSFLWVKVPSLSASTVLTVYVGGIVNGNNNPTDVWSRYVGVWHFAPSCVGGTTVPDATGNGFDATAAGGVLTEYAGPWGNSTIFSTVGPQAPDYDEALDNVAVFSASGWFKLPNYGGGSSQYANIISKKTGRPWNDDAGWYVQMNQSKTTAGLVCKNNETKYSSLSDVTANWHHLQVVSDGSTVKVYFDGKTTPDITMTYDVKASGTTLSLGSANSAVDEYRVRGAVSSAAEVALEYKTMKDVDFFEYGEIGPADPTAPVLSKPVIFGNDDGTFTVEEIIDGNMPKEGSVKIYYNGAIIPMSTSDGAVPATYTALVTPAAENVTDVLEIRAKSAVGGERVVTSSGFYNGELKIEKLRDASEKGLSNGVWRISRADDAHDLNVLMVRLDTSTADVGVDYVAFPLSAAIPDGTNSVDVVVTPIMNLDKDFDTWIDLAITNGAYKIDPAKFSDRLTIVNYEIPAGGNIWCAAEPGKASVASNWTSGTAPDSLTSVVFDGDVSQADCEWDVDAAHTVKSWTQMASYHGTVTIDTTYDDEFPELVINGDVIIGGGKWTHKGNYANFGGTEKNTEKIARKYRIVARVGGNLYLCAGASIDVTERGWGYVLPKQQNAGKAACHGGWMDNQNWSQEVCGDYREPTELGTGAISQGDWSGKSAIGGGAVKLVVGGEANLEGDLLADGTADTNGNTHRVTGSGGSIWVSARQISGAGRISTSTSAIFGNDMALTPGTGGRMALYTEEPLAKSREKLFCSGVAFSKTGSSTTKISGPGTIFIKDSTMSDGLLYIKQPASVCELSNIRCSTPVTGSWAFDKIILSGAVQLRVLPGNSLSVASLDNVVSEGNTSAKSAIVVPFGAHFDCGSGNQTIQPGVAIATEDFVFNGSITVSNGAKIGPPLSIYGQNSEYFDTSFSFTVSGSLDIEKGGVVGASQALSYSNTDVTRHAAHGGQSLWNSYHDGGYDSILMPSMPGASNYRGFKAGGVMKLEVGGELRVNGSIDCDAAVQPSDTTSATTPSASAGSVNIVAGSLSGTGTISANGGCGQWNYGGGSGGGRVAVYLTDAEATFTEKWVANINALGKSFESDKNVKAASAGTVYLVDGSHAADSGTIYVRNDVAFGRADQNEAETCIPGVDATCDSAEDLKKTSLYVDSAARVRLTDDMEGVALTLSGKSRLDLAGKSYTVRRALVNGRKIPVGSYAGGDETFENVLWDTAGGGTLRVTGYGLWVFIQ